MRRFTAKLPADFALETMNFTHLSGEKGCCQAASATSAHIVVVIAIFLCIAVQFPYGTLFYIQLNVSISTQTALFFCENKYNRCDFSSNISLEFGKLWKKTEWKWQRMNNKQNAYIKTNATRHQKQQRMWWNEKYFSTNLHLEWHLTEWIHTHPEIVCG